MRWIGVQFVITGAWSAKAEIADEKRIELKKEIEGLSANLLPRAAVRSLAGRVQWMTGLLPQLAPFAKMLWGALAVQNANDKIFRKQIAVALRWLAAFASDGGFPISRRIVASDGLHCTIIFDASPLGVEHCFT